MMILIRFLDSIINLYYHILKYKKCFVRRSVQFLIVFIVIACYASRDTQTLSRPNIEVLKVEKKIDTINYLLKITQRRDSLNVLTLRSIPTLQPVRSEDIVAISTRFGTRKDQTYGMNKFHNGIDFAANRGTPVYASGDGIVIDANYDNGYGNHVEIDHKNGYSTFYGHLNSLKVKPNQNVNRGDTIGTVGSTGVSTGYHLHYRVTYNGEPINPSKLFQ